MVFGRDLITGSPPAPVSCGISERHLLRAAPERCTYTLALSLSPEVSECQRCRRCRGSVTAVSRQCRLTLVSMVSRCVDPCRPVSTRVRGRIDSLYARHMS